MKRISTFVPWMCLAGALTVMPVQAEQTEDVVSSELSVPKAMRLLQQQGYHDFRKIKVERDEKAIEVEARDKEGRKVELEIDLYTGKVIDIH